MLSGAPLILFYDEEFLTTDRVARDAKFSTRLSSVLNHKLKITFAQVHNARSFREARSREGNVGFNGYG